MARPAPEDRDLAKCPRCNGAAATHAGHAAQHPLRILSLPERSRPADDVLRFPQGEGLHQAADRRSRSPSCARTSSASTARTAARRSISRSDPTATHCGSPLSMLDMQQAERLIAQLRRGRSRTTSQIDPAVRCRWRWRARRPSRDCSTACPASTQLGPRRCGRSGSSAPA